VERSAVLGGFLIIGYRRPGMFRFLHGLGLRGIVVGTVVGFEGGARERSSL
jgi:hypothetical protein